MHQVLVKLELWPVRISCFNYIANPNAECYLVAGMYFYVCGIPAHTSFHFSVFGQVPMSWEIEKLIILKVNLFKMQSKSQCLGKKIYMQKNYMPQIEMHTSI